MKAGDPRNQLKKRLAPGMWEDQSGNVHFSIPEILAFCGLEDTPENHELCKQALMEKMKQHQPNTPVLHRKSPTDDGKDIR